MIETKLYKVMLRRMSMTLLMVVLSATTIYADQTVKVDIKGSDNVEEWSLKVAETTIEFTDGVASVSGKAGKTAVLSLMPKSDYKVFNLYILETQEFGTRADISVPKISKISYTPLGNSFSKFFLSGLIDTLPSSPTSPPEKTNGMTKT